MKAKLIKEWLMGISDDQDIEALLVGGDFYEPIHGLQAVTSVVEEEATRDEQHK